MGTGMICVLLYAAALHLLQMQSTAATGAAFGSVLWLVASMLLIPLLLSWWGPDGELKSPGLFMLGLGQGWTPALIIFAACLIHGTIAGVIYKHAETPARQSAA